MKFIRLKITKEERKIIKNFDESIDLTIDEFVKISIIETIEDLIDIVVIEEYQKKHILRQR